jgi:hypothetical protein
MNIPDAPTAYVKLGLLIDRHFPGYVDGYFGPPELKAESKAREKPGLEELDALAQAIQEGLATDASMADDRREYLASELVAMRTTLRILRGDIPEIAEEVQSLFGVKPEWVEEREFEEAHQALNAILPGSEPLTRRVVDFRERTRIKGEVAAPIIQRLLVDLRQRTHARFPLPEKEECEVKLVNNQPWGAYNWYLGGGRSRIEFNQDIPIMVLSIPYTVAHEAYPGHHSEHAIKELRLYRQEGRLEHSILLNNTPSALVSEGIATNALEAIASQDEIASLLSDCYEAAGLPRGEVRRALDIKKASRPLSRVPDNQILLLHRNGLPDNELIAYGMRYALTDETLERKQMDFIKNPLWRSYHFNYTLGSELVSAFLDASPDRTEAFTRLLSEPITPGRMARSIAE